VVWLRQGRVRNPQTSRIHATQAEMGSARDIFGGLFGLAQLATYVMSLTRWFATPHDNFWLGFKELI